MSEHTRTVMSRYTMSEQQAYRQHNDLQEVVAILNKITELSFYRRTAHKKNYLQALEEIEAKSREARNILDAHIWPF